MGTHGIHNGQFCLSLNFSVLSKVEKHSRQREQNELTQGDVLEPHTNSLKWLKGLQKVLQNNHERCQQVSAAILHLIWHAPWGSGLCPPNGPVQHLPQCPCIVGFNEFSLKGRGLWVRKKCAIQGSQLERKVCPGSSGPALGGQPDTQGHLPWGHWVPLENIKYFFSK